MSLGYLKVASIGAAGVAGTAGTVYVGSKVVDFSSEESDNDEIIHTVRDKLKDRLISRTNFSKEWSSRLEKLKKDQDQDLHEGLRNIRDKNPKATGEDLKRWCADSSIEPYVEHSPLVKGMEKYCTYLLKEQISGLITGTGDSAWKDAKDRLARVEDDKLSEAMREVKKGNKLDSWCTEKYETPFQDKKDSLYLDVSKFCKKITKKQPTNTQPQAAKPATGKE
ncbi:hypothetical protein HF1_07630 [Mycoplasma haemofelis str. Langford 1]|uniref:Uncharacterized protein n=1 Tax=Mycoplasma haemofelis (strain Langford 1) TaxID=941640 RepID=E8ZI00_MYCHL|nr:hypothetical protein [Mycoplasma haemofelis]CBY92771.1 hypothetical protein HF1_07630 [Mycoplasma haemofelis str. Langford 1]